VWSAILPLTAPWKVYPLLAHCLAAYNSQPLIGLAAGTKLGPYEILAFLGAGGMGAVYRARDVRLERTVAIKILKDHEVKKSDAKERFEREARTISSLNHPNICHLYDVGEKEGVGFVVMEYLDGQTLADRLNRGPLPLDLVLQYGIEICDGLEIAHRGGVIHRDLKPGNIMLTTAGPKLMDFGLAKPLRAVPSELTQTLSTPKQQPLTTEGNIVGTLQYMAPEQAEGKELDRRSDIFSLGAILYEMTTGKRIHISNTSGASQPRWSREGRKVFFVQPDRKLMVVAFDPAKASAGPPQVFAQTCIVVT